MREEVSPAEVDGDQAVEVARWGEEAAGERAAGEAAGVAVDDGADEGRPTEVREDRRML